MYTDVILVYQLFIFKILYMYILSCSVTLKLVFVYSLFVCCFFFRFLRPVDACLTGSETISIWTQLRFFVTIPFTQILVQAPDCDVIKDSVLSDLHQIRTPYVGKRNNAKRCVGSEIWFNMNNPVDPFVAYDTLQRPSLCGSIWKIRVCNSFCLLVLLWVFF